MDYARINSDTYPVIEIWMGDVDPTPEEIDQFFKELDDALSSREGSYVTVVHGQKIFISGEARVKIGKMSKAMEQKYKGRSKGTIVITPNLISRMMIKGIAVVSKSSSPLKVVSAEHEVPAMVEKLLGITNYMARVA